MAELQLKLNRSNPDLWCLYSKQRIAIGKQYLSRIEIYGGEEIEKTYKVEYADFLDEE